MNPAPSIEGSTETDDFHVLAPTAGTVYNADEPMPLRWEFDSDYQGELGVDLCFEKQAEFSCWVALVAEATWSGGDIPTTYFPILEPGETKSMQILFRTPILEGTVTQGPEIIGATSWISIASITASTETTASTATTTTVLVTDSIKTVIVTATETVTHEATPIATNDASESLHTPDNVSESHSGLSNGGKAGVGVGVGIGVLLIIGMVWFFVQRRKYREALETGPACQNDRKAVELVPGRS